MRESTGRPAWAVAAEAVIKNRIMPLSVELQHEQLAGMRIFVVKNIKTGEVAPLTIVYGKNFSDYAGFADAVEKVELNFYAEHGVDKDGLALEDRWARSIEEFKRDNPELTR